MSVFTTFSAFSRIGRSEKYRLDALLSWNIGSKDFTWTLDVPPGTVFDITVPWYARLFGLHTTARFSPQQLSTTNSSDASLIRRLALSSAEPHAPVAAHPCGVGSGCSAHLFWTT